ncbi:hypothetical protein JTB14_028400 [Gonioctena quinquepunctata]|nr:hypothetical protein JTB14_028400 [Gonioctena quinquepunctata]
MPTYSEALQQSSNTFSNISPPNAPDIIIKPKIPQDVEKTKNEIINTINPSDLKIGIRSLKSTKSGSVIIKCKNKTEFEILENEIKNKMENMYNIEASKMKKPRIKIPMFQQNLSKEEIETSIKQQNEALDEIKVTFIKKGKNNKSTVYGECSPSTFRQLMRLNKVFIGWERYSVFEDLTVPRCFQCQEFYHKKQNCPNKLICPLCSEEHEQESCPKIKKVCANCVKSNDKYKLKNSVDHYSTDTNCPTLQFHINLTKNKIDYSS